MLFNIYYDYLLNIGVPDSHIIRIDLESIRYEKLRNPNSLYEYLESRINDKDKHYVFIDEIQMIDKFEDVVNGIKTDFNVDLYITGSNSKLLSSEINTKLRGRGIEIKVFPLSFKEFYDGKIEVNKAFNEYIKFGGLPYICSLDKEYEKTEYLKMINDTVSTKDIIERNNIRNEAVFNAVIDLLCSQIGSHVSPNKIVITMDNNPLIRLENGYKSINLFDFLLNSHSLKDA